jgi:hypothetical protein
MAVDPHADAPTVPQASPGGAGSGNPGDEPTVPQPTPSPASPTVTTPTLPVGGPPTVAAPTSPMAPTAPPAPAAPPPPEKWAGRVIVPGASAPGQKKKAAPTTPTHLMARQDTAVEARPAGPRAPGPATRAPAPYRPPRRRRRSLFRRFVTAIISLVLILAVPVVSAYVSYKLASGENPFEWPPTVDYDSFFPR